MLSSIIAPWMQWQHPKARIYKAIVKPVGARLEKLGTRFCQIELQISLKTC